MLSFCESLHIPYKAYVIVHLDCRHFISFVGLAAALVVVATVAAGEGMNLRQGVQSYYSTRSAWKVLLVISGLSEVFGCVLAFVAGSSGRRRVFLIAWASFLPFLCSLPNLEGRASDIERPLQPGSQQGPDSGEKGLDAPPASVNRYAEPGIEVQRTRRQLFAGRFRRFSRVRVNSVAAFLAQPASLDVLNQ